MRKPLIIPLLFVITSIIIIFRSESLREQAAEIKLHKLKEELSEIKEKASEEPLKTPVVSEVVKTPQRPKKDTGEAKKTPERRPLRFRKFRVVVEIYSEEPRDDNYVREETKKLVKLAKSVSDVKDIKIIELQGVSVTKGKAFNISLE